MHNIRHGRDLDATSPNQPASDEYSSFARKSATPMPTCSVSLLPIEILDTVVSVIEKRRDVIAFALACRTFYKIAVPRHSEYRLIRASYIDTTVWKHLCERRDLAAGVRAVHILESSLKLDLEEYVNPVPYTPRAYRTGAAFVPYTSKSDALWAIAHALGGMTRLQSFTWTFPLTLHPEPGRLAAAAVWAAVAKLPALFHLKIVQPLNPPGEHPVYPGEIERYPLWTIGRLSSITLVNVAFLRHAESVMMFARVLEQSPSLEALRIVLYDWNFEFSKLLGNVKLSQLKKLDLELYADMEVNEEAFARFLENTSSLQDLEWQYIPIRPLASGSLPRLKRLAGTYNLGAFKLLTDASLSPRPLEILEGFELRPESLTELAYISRQTLTRLELARFESVPLLADFVAEFPALRWLRVPSVDYIHDWRGVTRELVHIVRFYPDCVCTEVLTSIQGEWIDVLMCAPNIEVFHGPAFFKYPEHGSGDNDERAREIAALVPALRRVDHWTMISERAILIERDGRWREVVVDDKRWHT